MPQQELSLRAGQDLRSLRIHHEWEFADALLKSNPESLGDLQRERDNFSLTLVAVPTLILKGKDVAIETAHRVRFEFPRYYPAAPIEAYLSESVLHPNIHPENGFVCLWERSSPGDTIIEAVCQLRRILSWELVNLSSDHLMQPEVAQLFRNGSLNSHLPFECEDLVKPKAWLDLRKFKPPHPRPRLSSINESVNLLVKAKA